MAKISSGSIPSWLTPPPPFTPVTQALVTHTNPVTGETFTAPTGGYTVNVQAPKAQPAPPSIGNLPAPPRSDGGLTPILFNQPGVSTGDSSTDYGLPALRGSAAGESRIDPRLQPYLELGLRGAEQLFFGQQPQFFPGQTYVDPSEQTLAALQQQEELARAAQPALTASQEAYMGGLRQLGETASGAFLSGSPYLQSLIETATRPIAQQFQEQTLPSIASQYSAAGRYGSGAMARTTGQAQEGASRAIGDIATQLAAADYARERGFQQQAVGAQLDAARLAPQFYQQQFLPSQQLGQIGAAREAIAAQPLQEEMSRFQFGQQVPYQQLQGFLSSVYGTPLGSSQFQNIPQAQTNRFGQALGGAVLGSQLGGTTGAVLGGLGGLLF
jgi:hypothetical protein